jgi:hypothetical protein
MSARPVVAFAGLVFLGLGIPGLTHPRWVMEFVGYPAAPPTPQILGEVRAVYGGLFTAMGLFTVVAAANPAANRGALMLVGLLWLGVCGGRLAGAYVDGDPGLPGWIAFTFELFFGLLLALIALLVKPRPEKKAEEPVFPLAAGPTEL